MHLLDNRIDQALGEWEVAKNTDRIKLSSPLVPTRQTQYDMTRVISNRLHQISIYVHTSG